MSEKGPENDEIMGNYMKLPPSHGHSSWDLDGFRIYIYIWWSMHVNAIYWGHVDLFDLPPSYGTFYWGQ